MSGLRHDARVCRERAKSELIRHSLGIEFPEERARRLAHEQEVAAKAQKAEQRGIPLGLEDEA